jgi:hypothetical protein
MRSSHIVLALALSVSVVSSAWSADEPAQPATAPAAQPAQAPPAAQAAASSTSTATKTPVKETTTDTSSNSEVDVQEKRLLAEGYKKKTHNGQTVYCRKEIPLGSRFEKEVCGSAQDMALQEQRARDLMNGNKTTGAGSK